MPSFFPRRWPRWFRRLLVALTAGTGLLIGATLIFVIQGRREWTRMKTTLTAEGEKFSREDFVPPAVPDAENVFAAPIWDEIRAADGDMSKTRLRVFTEKLSLEKIAALTARFPELKIPAAADPKTVTFSLWKLAQSTTDQSQRRGIATEILAQLETTRPLTDEFSALLTRPAARFPFDPSAPTWPKLPHLSPLLTLGRILFFRAQAELVLGDRAAALADTQRIFLTANTLSSEPFLISLLVRSALIKQSLEIVETGIQRHEWKDADLVAIAAGLEKIDLVSSLAYALRGDATYSVKVFEEPFGDLSLLKITKETFRNGGLKGEGDKTSNVDLGLAAVSLHAHALLFGPRELAFYQGTIRERAHLLDLFPEQPVNPAKLEVPPSDALGRVLHPMSSISLSTVKNLFAQILFAQTIITQSRIACALERYRIASGSYPEQLSSLIPQYLPAVPRDVFGREFHYERNDASFRLWSVGWNLTDEKGTPAAKPSDHQTGDWVWPLKPVVPGH